MKFFGAVLPRVAAQGFLALSSYLVSITAAHTLGTKALALFFVGWTIESLWVGAIRMVVVPALLLHRTAPSLTGLIGVGTAAGTPLVVAVIAVSASGLSWLTACLLAATVWTLGAYELARSVFARSRKEPYALPLADGAVFILAVFGVGVGIAAAGPSLNATLVSISLASVLVTAAIGIFLRRSSGLDERFEPALDWLRQTWQLIRLGMLEWVVFFVTSMAGVALLGIIGGADVLAGVRLAETLVAPIGLVSSALPFLSAAALRDQSPGAVRWPKILRNSLLLLEAGALVYLIGLQVAPEPVLALLVGEHVEIARQASLGLAIGVLASLFASVATLVMKHRQQVRVLSRLRLVELIVSLPLIAAGAAFGTAAAAGMGISASQALPAAVQGFLHLKRVRKASDHAD